MKNKINVANFIEKTFGGVENSLAYSQSRIDVFDPHHEDEDGRAAAENILHEVREAVAGVYFNNTRRSDDRAN